MLKAVGLASIALALMVHGASAQANPEAVHSPLITWQGAATITAVPVACEDGARGIAVGDVLTSIYRPQLDPAEPRSAVTLIGDRLAHSFFKSTAGQMHGTGAFGGHWISGRATTVVGGAAANGTYNFKTTPVKVLPNTPFVTIVGTLTKFAEVTGCNIKFTAAYSRRPN